MPEENKLSHDQKREIAVGIFDGTIFTSAQVPEHDRSLTSTIFSVIMMLNPEQRAEFAKRDIGVLWEYMTEAFPRAINGYPMFPSVRTMSKADWEDVRKMVLKLTKLAKAL